MLPWGTLAADALSWKAHDSRRRGNAVLVCWEVVFLGIEKTYGLSKEGCVSGSQDSVRHAKRSLRAALLSPNKKMKMSDPLDLSPHLHRGRGHSRGIKRARGAVRGKEAKGAGLAAYLQPQQATRQARKGCYEGVKRGVQDATTFVGDAKGERQQLCS